MTIMTISPKGQVVIPVKLRKKLGIRPGGKVVIKEKDGYAYIQPVPDDPVAALSGMCAGKPSLTEALLKAHAEELENEKAKSARFFRRSGSPK